MILKKEQFPLQTHASLAERWGVSRQVVKNWSDRHSDFPDEITGLVERDGNKTKYYAMNDVKRYEKTRGIIKKTNSV